MYRCRNVLYENIKASIPNDQIDPTLIFSCNNFVAIPWRSLDEIKVLKSLMWKHFGLYIGFELPVLFNYRSSHVRKVMVLCYVNMLCVFVLNVLVKYTWYSGVLGTLNFVAQSK